MSKPDFRKTTAYILTMISIYVICIASYVTHLIWMIRLFKSVDPVSLNHSFLAIIGALVPFVGMLNGVLIWFGG